MVGSKLTGCVEDTVGTIVILNPSAGLSEGISDGMREGSTSRAVLVGEPV